MASEPSLSPTSLRDVEKRPYQYEAVSEDERFSKTSAIDQRMKRKIRRLRIIQRTLSLIIAIVVFGFMLNTYVTFVTHRTIQSGGQTIAIYPVHPITWPTFMMIGTGAVSILFNTSIMVAYCWGVGAANRISNWSSYWGYLVHVVNIIIWVSTSTIFQMSQGAADAVPPPRDLYGWTCSDKSDQLTAEYNPPVNFNLQCQTQQASFAFGVINAAMDVFALCISFYAMRRMIHKKRMELMERRLNNGVPTAQ